MYELQEEMDLAFTLMSTKITVYFNKRPTGLIGHLSIRNFTLTSCQKGSYLNNNSPFIK